MSQEEKAIEIAERGLRFHYQDPTRIDSIIRKYSSAGKINESQLKKIGDSLSVQFTNVGPHEKIEGFLYKIKGNEWYKTEDLLVIGLLLARGSPETKAKLLFEVFDTELEGQLSKSRVREVLETLCTHSLTTLPSLVSKLQSPFSNEFKITQYIADLEQTRSLCINRVCDRMSEGTETISISMFVDGLSTYMHGILVDSKGWRAYLREIYLTRQPQLYTPHKLLN